MEKRICALLAVVPMLFASCKGKVSSDMLMKKQEGPFETVRQVVLISQSGRYDELDRYIYGVPVDKGKNNSLDLIKKGIRDKKKEGNFAYSDEAFIRILTDYRAFMKPADGFQLKAKILSDMYPFRDDPYIVSLVKNSPHDIIVFTRNGATVVFIRHEGVFKIIYSMNITRLSK